MERKYRSQKKAILVIAIICVLLIAVIVYFQIRIKNVKAEKVEEMEQKVTDMTAEQETLQQAFDAKDYKNTADAMKDQVKELESQKKELLAPPAPEAEATEEPTAEPTEEPTEAPAEDAAAAEATAEPEATTETTEG